MQKRALSEADVFVSFTNLHAVDFAYQPLKMRTKMKREKQEDFLIFIFLFKKKQKKLSLDESLKQEDDQAAYRSTEHDDRF